MHYHNHNQGRTTYLVGGGSDALGGEEHELNGGDLRLNLLKLGLQAAEMHISNSILAAFWQYLSVKFINSTWLPFPESQLSDLMST